MLKLRQILDDFMTHGLEDFPGLMTFGAKREDEDECLQLENTWREFVDEQKLEELDKRQTDCQEAVWEVIQTEATYIKDLRIVVDLYLGTLVNLQGAMMLNDIETEKIFANISDIESIHYTFWKEKLSAVVKKARREDGILSVSEMANAFEDFFTDIQKPYDEFNKVLYRCMKYLSDRARDDEMFRYYLEWGRSHPKSRDLELRDLLDFPMNRITSYPSLLAKVETTLNGVDGDKKVAQKISKVKRSAISLSDQLREGRERQMDELFKNLHSPGQENEDRVFPGSSPRSLKKRLTLKENDKMLKLQRTLDDFMTHGLQDFPGLCTYSFKRDENENVLDIENSWRDLVDKEKLPDLDKRQTAQQDAIWEILSTEVYFLKDIRIITDLYLCALVNLQSAMILNEVETEKIFSTVSEIAELHRRFWKERLSCVAMKLRTDKKLPSVCNLVEAFEGFGELFTPYLSFGTCRTECRDYLGEQAQRNSSFQCFLKWAERHPQNRGLKLEDLLDLPFQHMAKYLSFISALEKTLDDQSKSELVLRTLSQAKGFVMQVLETTGLDWNELNVAEENTVKTTLRRKTPVKICHPTSNGTSQDFIPASGTDGKMTKLRQSLNDFMIHGLEDFPGLLTFDTGKDEDLACLQIEESWRCLVEAEIVDELTEQEIDRQNAIWNIITKEVSHIKNLRIITDFYLRALVNLQGAMILNEIETEKVFANISRIEKLHTKFWTEELCRVVMDARVENRLPVVEDLAGASSGFAALSATYIKYCAFRNGCRRYLEEQVRHNEFFRCFVEWGRRHPTSHDLNLQELLEYPVQYISEYPILLTAVEKTLNYESEGLASKALAEAKDVAIKICQEAKRLNKQWEETEQDAVRTTCSEKAEEDGQHSLRSPTTASNSFAAVSNSCDDKLVKLKQTLDDFMIHGFQEFPALLSFGSSTEEDGGDCQIDDSWRALTCTEALSGLSEDAVAQQDAIWNIVTSEAAYIKNIRVVLDLYLRALINLQGAILLNEIETEKIFGNISTIEKLHTRFWKEKLHVVVKKARDEQRFLSVADLVDALERFPDLLNPYVRFCTHNSASLAYLREQTQTNKMFGEYIEWAERHPKSRGLKLHELLRFPCQRVTEYHQLFLALEQTLDDSGSKATSAKIAELKENLLEFSIGLTKVLEERQSLDPNAVVGAQHTSPTGMEGSKMIMLRQALDDFMSDGLQDFPALLTFGSKEEDDGEDECFEIEESWRAFVDEGELEDLSKNQTELQDAMWKIISSEVAYTKNISVITNLYLCTLVNLQAAMMLNEIDTAKAFSNISTIKKLHTTFWRKKLLRVVQRARQEKQLISTLDFIKAFEGFSTSLNPYVKFCRDNSESLAYLSEQIKVNDMFRVFLDWAQNHPKNRGRELRNLLVCPAQRIFEYPILLSEVEKADDGNKEELSQRISEIREFVKQIQKEPTPTYSRRLRSDEVIEARRSFRRKKEANKRRPYSEGSMPVFAHVPTAEESKLVKLQNALDDLMVRGLQDFPSLLAFGAKREEDKESPQIENSWRDLVNQEDLSRLNKKQVKQQDAVWEILSTEATYIQNIRIIVDFYLCALLNLQGAMLLNEIETEKIFQNVSVLERLHTKFWNQKLSKVVQNAKQERRLPSVQDLLKSFEGFTSLCAPYAKYCSGLDECMKYLRETTDKNKLFRHFLQWAQRHPESRRLKLQELLHYPLSRIDSYPVLLQLVERTQDDQDRVNMSKTIKEMKIFLMELSSEFKHR